MVTIDTLRKAELFGGLSDDELRLIAEVAREERYEAGSVFHREGVELEALYFVRSGRVRVELDLDLKPHLERSTFLVDRLRDGAAFGWSSLVEPYVSTATVKAEQDTEDPSCACQKNGFHQKLLHDIRRSCPDGFPDADFPRSLFDGNEHDVHHPDSPDQQPDG